MYWTHGFKKEIESISIEIEMEGEKSIRSDVKVLDFGGGDFLIGADILSLGGRLNANFIKKTFTFKM